MNTKPTYIPLNWGPLQQGDLLFGANYRDDCEAKKRWHRVPPLYWGKNAQARRFHHLKFKRRIK
jgi:hypothetical protein